MTSTPSVRRFRWRWPVFFLAFPLILWMLSVAVVRILLVRDQSTPDWGNTIALVNGPEIDEVVSLYRDKPTRKILVGYKVPDRPMQLGVLPEFHVHMKNELKDRGVPEDAILVSPSLATAPPMSTDWDSVTSSTKNDQQDPVQLPPMIQLIVVADRLSSGRVRQTRIPKTERSRAEVRVFARSLSGLNEFNWWYRPSGIVRVVRELSLRHHPDSSIEGMIWWLLTRGKPTQSDRQALGELK